MEDRFRDVVVVTDAATVTLLLRTLAPDQLPMAGAVTEVGLPRGSRPVPLVQAALGGGALAFVAVLAADVVPFWVLPLLVLVAGLALLLVPRRRHLGEALLISVAVGIAVSLLSIAGSTRFPGELVKDQRPGASRAGVRRSTATIAQTVRSSVEARSTTPPQPRWLHAALPRLPNTEEPT